MKMIKRLSAVILGAILLSSMTILAQTEKDNTSITAEGSSVSDTADLPMAADIAPENSGMLPEKPYGEMNTNTTKQPRENTQANMQQADSGEQNIKTSPSQGNRDAFPPMNGDNGSMDFPAPPEDFPRQWDNEAMNGERQPGQNTGRRQPGGMGNMDPSMFGGGFSGENMQVTESTDTMQDTSEPQRTLTFKEIVTTYSTPIFSMLLLSAAFVFVIFYKRKSF